MTESFYWWKASFSPLSPSTLGFWKHEEAASRMGHAIDSQYNVAPSIESMLEKPCNKGTNQPSFSVPSSPGAAAGAMLVPSSLFAPRQRKLRPRPNFASTRGIRPLASWILPYCVILCYIGDPKLLFVLVYSISLHFAGFEVDQEWFPLEWFPLENPDFCKTTESAVWSAQACNSCPVCAIVTHNSYLLVLGGPTF